VHIGFTEEGVTNPAILQFSCNLKEVTLVIGLQADNVVIRAPADRNIGM
jgi:hypothetical protein